MSWHFSQALVAAFSAGKSSAGELSAPSSMKNMPQVYSSSDKMTAFCLRSRYGMTCEPSMVGLGGGGLMPSAEDSRARTSLQSEGAKESPGNGLDCGPRCEGSWAKWNPDSSSWKTRQCSLLGGLESFSETWPKWGSMRNGACFQRQTAVPNICESASGFWQTPVADDAANRANGKWNSRGEPKLSAQVMLENPWPTPTKSDGSGGPGVSGRAGGLNLRTAVGGQLNPAWVERMMGWPDGWTDLALREPVPVPTGWGEDWEGDVSHTVTGVPHRTSRLKALGNGQVPQAAAAAWLMLTQKSRLTSGRQW